jgi:UDP-N-acetylmuramate--alanine ligase
LLITTVFEGRRGTELLERIESLHFIGVGGAGMNGIAQILLELGYKVSGSDLNASPTTEKLTNLGGKIYIGHDEKNVRDADLVVVSSAVPANNVELKAAKELGIPIVKRAEMLAELMKGKYSIAVAGAHGKTTTTSMISLVLENAGLDPTIIIGGELKNIGGNAKCGKSKYLVAEADESDGSFLCLCPTIAVITNIEDDHLDHYGSKEKIFEAFIDFANLVPDSGFVVMCIDDPGVRAVLPKIKKEVITYSINDHPQADFCAKEIELDNFQSTFFVYWEGKRLGKISLMVPGRHNVSNALAAVIIGRKLGIPMEQISEGLLDFKGAKRRFQLIGEAKGIKVVDDYAHHPTEIMATLQAAKQGNPKRMISVFQPHRYSRTKMIGKEFGKAFSAADLVIVTDIYPAGEEPILGVSSQIIIDSLKEHRCREVVYIPEKEKVVDYLKEILQPGDLVMTIGAGNIWTVAEELVSELQKS